MAIFIAVFSSSTASGCFTNFLTNGDGFDSGGKNPHPTVPGDYIFRPPEELAMLSNISASFTHCGLVKVPIQQPSAGLLCDVIWSPSYCRCVMLNQH
jgi:hypothetical protein